MTKKTKEKKKQAAKPRTKYETVVLPRLLEIEAWARDGVIDRDIAKNLGMAYSTFNEYKKRPELSEALKKSKAVADIIVENALFKKATGYTQTVKKTFKCKVVEYDETTGRKIRESEELREGVDEVHVPPDTTAQIYWLNNRKPEVWRNKQDVRTDGNISVSVELGEADSLSG